MRILRWSFFLLICPCVLAQAPPTAPPPRDPRAIAVLQQSLAAMGGTVPADTVAAGTVEIVEGSRTENGTFRSLTRGSQHTSEEMNVPSGRRKTNFSRGVAADVGPNGAKTVSMELAASSQASTFPLALIGAALNDQESVFEYVGLETVDATPHHHIRVSKTFASNEKLRRLAEFSAKEIWISASTLLPARLSFEQRAGSGAVPRIPHEISYSDYRNVGGILYPHLILRSLNGMPWATIRITSVSLNTGLADSEFAVR